MAEITQITDGIHRVKDGLVNFYVVEEQGEVMLVDAGWPRSYAQVEQAMTQLKHAPGAIHHVLLTHGHPDHVGAAEKVRVNTGATVHAFAGEVDRVKGEAKGSSPFSLVPGLLPHLWRPSANGFVLRATGRGFMFPTWVKEVSPFASGAPLDLPGRPTPVETPGHTAGHVSFLFADAGVLIAGDAIATLDPLTQTAGPRLLPDALNGDPAQTRASLDVVAAQQADTLLPGHGEPFRGDPAEAVGQARATA